MAAGVMLGLAGPASARGIALPSMPMSDALLALAHQSGHNILFVPATVAGLRARAVDAVDFDQALRQMTRGMPLRIVPMRGGAVKIEARAAPPVRRPQRAASRSEPRAAEASQNLIVVTGARRFDPGLGEADPLALQSSITATDLQRLPDRTIAETLGRLPGVLTLSTSLEGSMGGIDHAGRAEGDFIALRGLHGAYVETRIDGITVPQTLPYSRGAELGLLPDGVARIAVVKILGPDHAGNADGGVIDIRGPNPRDPAVQGLHVHALGARDQRALDYGQGGTGVGVGGSFASTSSGGRLAVVIGADYAQRSFANAEQTYQAGNLEYRITDAAGNSAPGLDPARNLMLTSVNAEITRGESRDLSVYGAADYRVSGHFTVFARVRYAEEHVRQDVFQIGFQGGRDPSYIAHVPIGGGLYRTESVKSELHYWFETNPEASSMTLGQIGGHWQDARSDIVARGFVAAGQIGRPDHLEISFWDPQATRLDSGLTVSGRYFPAPLLTTRDAALVARPLEFPVHDEGEEQVQQSRDTRLGGDVVLRHRAEAAVVRSWSVGAELVASHRSQWMYNLSFPATYPAGTTLGATGLVSGTISALLPGVYDYAVPLIDDDRLASALAQASATPLGADDLNGATIVGYELRAAIYGSVRVGGPAFEIEPGIRLQSAHIANRYWLSGNDGVPLDGIAYGWNHSARTYRAVLPSLMGRWRVSGGLIVRGGLWRSQSQPADYQLAGGGSVTQQADGSQILERGNPALKAVDASNADLAAEWHGAEGATLSLAGFAKRLDHYLYDMGTSVVAAVGESDGIIAVREPHNGGTATIVGLEAAANWPLAALSPLLAGWSIGGEATLLRSRVRLDLAALDRVEQAQSAPGHSATVRLGYARGRLVADAALNFVGAYVQQYGLYGSSLGAGASVDASAIDQWVRPSRRLDFSIAYRAAARTTLRLSVRNALDDIAYRATLGRESDAVPETVVSGRQVAVRFDRAW